MQELKADKGASAEDWFHFDFVLGLGANLLPCVPAGDDVRVLAGSALEGRVGKIPSQFNHAGEAHGLKDWQKREIMSNEVVAWSKDRRLNLCVRLGEKSGLYAFDIDIDSAKAEAVRSAITAALGFELPVRGRPNSKKILLAFRMEETCKKRIINVTDGRIEQLADGQQFVACGAHSSGARYQWLPTLPDQIPTLSMAQVNSVWQILNQTFATTPSTRKALIAQATETQPTGPTALMDEISDADWLELLEALKFLLPHAADNDTWSSIGYSLLTLKNKPSRQLWIDFSKKAPGYEPGAPEHWWETHQSQTPRTDFRHIFSLARQRGRENVADPAAFTPVISEGAGEDPGEQQTGSIVSDAPIKPIIQISDSRFSEIVDQLETILTPEIFVQGPALVRRCEAHTVKEIQRSSDAVMLVEVTREWLKIYTDQVAEWQKYVAKDGQGWVKTKPSDEHVAALLNRKGWTKLRPLEAIARAPFVREDGSICDEPGYDSRSRVLYVPGATFPPIPTDPSYTEAHEALERVRGVFDQFPWKERASESAFLAHILSESARLAIDRCPMFFYDAPYAGTGKSLLQEMAARIVHGTEPAVRPWVGEGDEIRKALYAALLSGDRSMWFDNISDGQKIRSPELCAFITSATWSDRKLGESSSVGIPNRMVLVGSGNNITPTGDLARRSLVIRMDANTEDLKERTFKIPLLRSYVDEHRPQLLVDTLTIIRAYAAAEKQDHSPMPVRLPSFEQWSKFCREPLIWLGLADPVITQNETDDGRQSVGAIFTGLRAVFEDRPFTSLDIARIVNSIADVNGELGALMQQNGCPEPNSSLKVGYWLRGYRDRISSGLKLCQAGSIKTGARWKILTLEEDRKT